MKNALRYVFSCCMVLSALLSGAQSYVISNSVLNTGNPGGVKTSTDPTTTGGTKILLHNDGGSASTNYWSAKATLPFAFNFYGAPVTKFIVSKNGLLSFDTVQAGTAVNSALNVNGALPNPLLPPNTIAYFWEDFGPALNSGDDVYQFTFGTAPNRQCWVLNYSYKVGSQSSFAYWAVVFEEGTNRIYVVDMNYASTPSSYSGTVGIQVNALTSYQVTTPLNGTMGSPDIIMGPGSTGAADNEYYQFDYFGAGACTPPFAFLSTAVTATSASISWMPGSGSTVDIDYGAAGHAAGSGTLINSVPGTTRTITSLSPATTYDIYIRSRCSASNTSSWIGPVRVTTLCNAIIPVVLPFNDGFENYTGSYMAAAQFCQSDRNWSYTNTDPTGRLRFNAGATYAKTGTNAATLDKTPAGSVQTNSLVLTLDLSNYTTKPLIALSFNYMHHGEESHAGDRVFARGNNTMPWVEIYNLFANQGAAGQYNFVQNLNLVDLLGIAAQTVSSSTQIKFSQEDDNPSTSLTISDGYTFDDISIISSDCGSVSNFAVTSLSGSSIQFSWLGSATGKFNIEWGPVGFLQGTGTNFSVNGTTTANLTGLSGHSSYWVYLRQDCGASGNGFGPWSGPHLVTTAYIPPYFQDFSGGYPGVSEFTEAKGIAKNPTVFSSTTTSNWISDGYSNVGTSGAARLNIFGTTAQEWMLTPSIDLGTGTVYQLEFDASLTQYNNTNASNLGVDDSVFVIISTDNGLTWSQANTLLSLNQSTPVSNGNGSHYVVSLAPYSGTVRFGFYGESTVSNVDNDFFVDNIHVRIPPLCQQPTSISINNIGTDSAQVNWVADTTILSVIIEYGLNGFTPGTGMPDTVLNTGSAIIHSLIPSSNYQVYLSSLCLSSASATSSAVAFQTLCDTLPLPWSESFESVSPGNLPNCWLRASSTYWTTNNTGVSTYNRKPRTGNNYMTVRYGVDEWAYTPKFHLQAGQSYEFSFWYLSDNLNGWDSLVTAFFTDQTQSALVSRFGSKLVNIKDTVFTQYTGTFIPSATGDYHIGIKVKANSTPWYLTFDDLQLREDPSLCPQPGAVAISGITAASANLNWLSPLAQNWTIEWGPAGFTQGSSSANTLTVSTLPYTLTGLSTNTRYDVYIRANCGGPSSSYAGPFTFKTDCSGSLNGTYTVFGTPGTKHYNSLEKAMRDLSECGVTGPVTLDIRPGYYTGSYELGQIPGTSAVNTVTIKGTTAHSVTLDGSNLERNTTLYLNGAKHVTIQGLNITNSANNAFGILLSNNADSNTINGCRILMDTTTTSSVSGGIIISNSTTSATTSGALVDHLTLTNNYIEGGYRGISVYGSTTVKSQNITIANNTLKNVYYYGIYEIYSDGSQVLENSITKMRNTTSYGIYLSTSDNFVVNRNTAQAVTAGMYCTSCNSGLTVAPMVNASVVNNMFAATSNTGAGMYFTSAKYIDVYHNTVRGAYGFRGFTSSLNNYVNNIFTGNSNYAFELSVALDAAYELNYNLYDYRGATAVKNGTPVYASLALWKTAEPLLNLNSKAGDPIYAGVDDLHVVGALPNDAGKNTLGIAVDIDGDIRPAAGSLGVDIGADEFTPLLFDVELVEIISPTDNICGDSATEVKAIIKNIGLSTSSAFGLEATINLNGVLSTLSATYSGSLASTLSDTVTLGTFNSSAGGSYTIQVYHMLSADQNKMNDTASVSVVIRDVLPMIPSASAGSFCTGDLISLYYPANAVGNLEWRSANGTTIGAADSLMVGPLGFSDTTFYLAAVSQNFNVGPVDNTIGAGGNFASLGAQKLQISVLQSVTIDSVAVYPNAAGTVYFNVYDAAGVLQQFATAPVSTPGVKTMIYVGLTLNPGTYSLDGVNSTTGGLYRNSAGASYPYDISGVLSITGNTFSTAYYYYFYDWRVSAGGCPRPEGSITLTNIGVLLANFTENSATATPGATVMTVNFDATASVGANSYNWNFGDNTTGTGVTTQHAYVNNGTYTVTLTISGPCGTRIFTKTIVVAGISLNESLSSGKLNIYPNPVQSVLKLQLKNRSGSDMEVRIITMDGKEVYRKTEENLNSESQWTIDVRQLARGVYILEVNTENGVMRERLIKE